MKRDVRGKTVVVRRGRMPGFVVRAGVQNEEKRAITMFGIIFPHWRVGTALARPSAQVVY